MALSEHNAWLLAFTALAHLGLGLVVIFKDPRGARNRLLFGLALAASWWSFSVMNIVLHTEHGLVLFWVRMAHAAAIVVAWFVFGTALAWEQEGPPVPTWLKHALLGLVAVVVAANLGPYIVEDVEAPLTAKITVTGSFFWVYAGAFFALIVLALGRLWSQLHLSRGLRRTQLRYLFWGIALSLVLGTVANMFLHPWEIEFLDLRPFGPVFSLIMVASISYAIVRFRLLEIRFVLRRVLPGALSAVLLFGGLVLLVLLAQDLGILPPLGPRIWMLLGVLVLVGTGLYPLLRGLSSHLIDTYLYPKEADYHRNLVRAGREMVTMLDRSRLASHFLQAVVRNMGLEYGLFAQRDGEDFVPAAVDGPAGPEGFSEGWRLAADHPLVQELQTGQHLVNQPSWGQGGSPDDPLEDLEPELVLPLLLEGEVKGLMVLGPKASGEPFSREDEHLLSALVSELGVVWKNTLLYEQVLDMKLHLENLVRHMDSGLAVVDHHGTITLFNPAAEEITGVSGAEAVGSNARKVLPGELTRVLDRTLWQGTVRQEVELESRGEQEARCLVVDSNVMPASASGEQGTLMVLSDVTQIRALQQERDRNQRLASLGELAAGMAHEIKNPLVYIRTFAELLPERYDDPDFRDSFSRIVTGEIERINRIVQDLLTFGKDSAFQWEWVDLAWLLDEILTLLEPQLQHQQVEVERAWNSRQVLVPGDRNQLKQALFNICLNGVEAMPDGGTLRLEMGRPEARADGDDEPVLRVAVADNGQGIASGHAARIFDPFFTTKEQGIGIGLSLSHRVITAHGGRLDFRSSEQGTRFEVLLPACPGNLMATGEEGGM